MADYFPVVNANESLLTLYDPAVDHFMSILNSTTATFTPCADVASLSFIEILDCNTLPNYSKLCCPLSFVPRRIKIEAALHN